jgi:hypothetical protein
MCLGRTRSSAVGCRRNFDSLSALAVVGTDREREGQSIWPARLHHDPLTRGLPVPGHIVGSARRWRRNGSRSKWRATARRHCRPHGPVLCLRQLRAGLLGCVSDIGPVDPGRPKGASTAFLRASLTGQIRSQAAAAAAAELPRRDGRAGWAPWWRSSGRRVHHTRRVADMRPGERTKLTDLVAVCSNCHRMLHNASPMLTTEQLREMRGRSR